MNLRWREYPILLQVLLGFLLFLFLLTLTYLYSLIQPSLSRLELFARANSTRTAIALTSQALFGPFPTATGPTRTPVPTRTITPTPTNTSTGTSTPTAIRYFINTATPRTLVPNTDSTSVVIPTNPPPVISTPRPTNPPQVTNPPPQVTQQPPRPTHQPRRPTHTPRPPRPTRTPRR